VQAQAAKRPGVYEFLDRSGTVMYVGKAKDVRTRLLSYFSAPWPESKSARLIRAAADLRWRHVPSEFAALLEEQRLIHQLKPAYNVTGNRTWASLAFIKLTHGPAPRLVVSESARDPASRYYGPFRGRGNTEYAVRTLADLLGLRDCAERQAMAFADQPNLFDAPLAPACIRHELGT
jgi:excinuclease UvrABC nuclease subunit